MAKYQESAIGLYLDILRYFIFFFRLNYNAATETLHHCLQQTQPNAAKVLHSPLINMN